MGHQAQHRPIHTHIETGHRVQIGRKATLQDSNPKYTPLPKHADFGPTPTGPDLLEEATQHYQSIIGDLRYLADSTRIYNEFETSRPARHAAKPTEHHMALLKYCVKYFNNTRTNVLHYHRKITYISLDSYSDADYEESADRTSTKADIQLIHVTPASCSSQKNQDRSQHL